MIWKQPTQYMKQLLKYKISIQYNTSLDITKLNKKAFKVVLRYLKVLSLHNEHKTYN